MKLMFKKFPASCGTRSYSPQELAIGPSPEPDEPSPHPQNRI